MRIRPRNLFFWTAIVFLTIAASGQLAVDATGPIRQRHRDAGAGHGGGVGHKLPLHVAIESHGVPAGENSRTLVEFIITNSGKEDLPVPVSPHPGDFEPTDPKTGYTVRCMGLRITSGKAPGTILPGGADLYGSQKLPGTLLVLAPGESIHVFTRVALPSFRALQLEAVFVADVILNDETIRSVDGRDFSDMREIGSASSEEYTSQRLLTSHD